MKKPLILLFSSALLLSSCGTYTGSGAYVGGSFGSILGSAIGGIAGGPRGSDIGTIIGMAGGAAVGAAIGNQLISNKRSVFNKDGSVSVKDKMQIIKETKDMTGLRIMLMIPIYIILTLTVVLILPIVEMIDYMILRVQTIQVHIVLNSL